MATHESHGHSVGFAYYTIIWITLIALTSLTVAVAGIDFGNFTLLVALLIATIKAAFVINIFMHIKFDDVIFKVFFAVTLLLLLIVFVFTAFDIFYR